MEKYTFMYWSSSVLCCSFGERWNARSRLHSPFNESGTQKCSSTRVLCAFWSPTYKWKSKRHFRALWAGKIILLLYQCFLCIKHNDELQQTKLCPLLRMMYMLSFMGKAPKEDVTVNSFVDFGYITVFLVLLKFYNEERRPAIYHMHGHMSHNLWFICTSTCGEKWKTKRASKGALAYPKLKKQKLKLRKSAFSIFWLVTVFFTHITVFYSHHCFSFLECNYFWVRVWVVFRFGWVGWLCNESTL